MRTFEKVSIWIRHLSLLENAGWLWDRARPAYQRAIDVLGSKGLERVINGSDRILLSPKVRGVGEKYEPEVWKAVMAELKPGDTFVDVGAFIGLYSIAVGLRLRSSGQVIAFEPDSKTFALLKEHAGLNGLSQKIELHMAAVSDKDGHCYFLADGSSQAQLVSSGREDATIVDVVTLDGALNGKHVDILKIDVEGYEEAVLRGAAKLLGAPECRPRAIFIEVHPYAWEPVKTTSASLLGLLNEMGYRVQTMDGVPVNSIQCYGEIVARSQL